MFLSESLQNTADKAIQIHRLHSICTITETLTNSLLCIFQTNKDVSPLHINYTNIQYYQSILDKIWEFKYVNTLTIQKSSVTYKAILHVSLMSHYFVVRQHSKIVEVVFAVCHRGDCQLIYLFCHSYTNFIL